VVSGGWWLVVGGAGSGSGSGGGGAGYAGLKRQHTG